LFSVEARWFGLSAISLKMQAKLNPNRRTSIDRDLFLSLVRLPIPPLSHSDVRL